jgi:uncharacterized protein YbjT (DUF2867 family)
MRVLITGATGFVGTGVLAESLACSQVDQVVVLGRSACGTTHKKLDEILVDDFSDLTGVTERLEGLDAMFWCLGTSSAGMDEASYTRITHDYAIEAARMLAPRNPGLIFCFLSGAGADGNAMWARVKKRTESGLRELGLRGVVVFRPAYIRDRHGAELRRAMFKVAYALMTGFSPLIRAMGGGTSNAEIGRAMIVSARDNLDGRILDSAGINEVAAKLDSTA